MFHNLCCDTNNHCTMLYMWNIIKTGSHFQSQEWHVNTDLTCHTTNRCVSSYSHLAAHKSRLPAKVGCRLTDLYLTISKMWLYHVQHWEYYWGWMFGGKMRIETREFSSQTACFWHEAEGGVTVWGGEARKSRLPWKLEAVNGHWHTAANTISSLDINIIEF